MMDGRVFLQAAWASHQADEVACLPEILRNPMTTSVQIVFGAETKWYGNVSRE